MQTPRHVRRTRRGYTELPSRRRPIFRVKWMPIRPTSISDGRSTILQRVWMWLLRTSLGPAPPVSWPTHLWRSWTTELCCAGPPIASATSECLVCFTLSQQVVTNFVVVALGLLSLSIWHHKMKLILICAFLRRSTFLEDSLSNYGYYQPVNSVNTFCLRETDM